jgi:RNA polymerase sigma factor (sigma-70 family)
LSTLIMLDDYGLVDGCSRQDRIVQRQLYERFAGRLFVVCKRYCRDAADAEDVLQESFVKAYRYIDKFRFDGSLEGWLKRIVVNTALKHIKQQKIWANTADIDEVAHVGCLAQADESLPSLNYQYLLGLIQELPIGCRTVFNLYAIEGYTHVEIAEMLGLAEGTSKSQYARARMMLQQKLMNEPRRTNEPV